MTLDDTVLIAIVGAIPATIAALSSLLNGQKANINRKKIDEVHDVVNGGLAAAKAEIVTLKVGIDVLEKKLFALEEKKKL